MLPYSAETHLDLLLSYNSLIQPLQITGYLTAVFLLVLLLWPRGNSDRLVAGLLALGWGWTGYAYLVATLSEVNWGAYVFGAAFGVEALLLLWSGTLRGNLRLRGDRSAASWAGLFFILFALAVYPGVPLLLGHEWQTLQHVGTAPAPTVILTIGVLLLAAERTPVHLLAIPVIWSIADGATAWALGLWWDLSLPAAGMAAVFLSIVRPRV